jgi:hypothetical protein
LSYPALGQSALEIADMAAIAKFLFRMTKFRLIGVAAVLFSVLAGPAMARHVIASTDGYAQSIYCATSEAGNPHSKYCDYMAWSAWRQHGAWDSTLDNACWHNPSYVPGECGWAYP